MPMNVRDHRHPAGHRYDFNFSISDMGRHHNTIAKDGVSVTVIVPHPEMDKPDLSAGERAKEARRGAVALLRDAIAQLQKAPA